MQRGAGQREAGVQEVLARADGAKKEAPRGGDASERLKTCYQARGLRRADLQPAKKMSGASSGALGNALVDEDGGAALKGAKGKISRRQHRSCAGPPAKKVGQVGNGKGGEEGRCAFQLTCAPNRVE